MLVSVPDVAKYPIRKFGNMKNINSFQVMFELAQKRPEFYITLVTLGVQAHLYDLMSDHNISFLSLSQQCHIPVKRLKKLINKEGSSITIEELCKILFVFGKCIEIKIVDKEKVK
jgi:hypothetical protein